MDSVQVERFIPLVISIIFYSAVFLLAEVSRKIVDYAFKPHRLWHVFFMELIASICMSTCVYENGIILKHYGVYGFFFIVFGLLITASFVNRGAFVNPMPVIELGFNGAISSEKLIALLTAETLGGYSAFRVARSLWYYSMNLASDHHFFYEQLPCLISYKIPFWGVMLYEFIGCFVLRVASSRLPTKIRGYLMPALVSFLLSTAFVYVGVPALNPVTVSARMMNCPGLDTQWFMLTYWVIPCLGWLLAAQLDSSKKPVEVLKEKIPKKVGNKKKTN